MITSPQRASEWCLRYEIGLEHSPTDPWGRVLLEIDGQGRAKIDNRGARHPPRAWRGQVAPEALALLLASLGEAGFPDCPAPDGPLRPDMTIGVITLTADHVTRRVAVEPGHARNLVGYRDAFVILGSLVHQLTQGVIAQGPNELPPSVSDVAREQ